MKLVPALAAAGLGLAVMLPAAPAYAFTCPTGGICTFDNENLTGTTDTIPNSVIPVGTVFNFLDAGQDDYPDHADSVRNKSGRDLWLKNRSTGVAICILPGNWLDSHDYYGYAERSSGTACTEPEPGNLAPVLRTTTAVRPASCTSHWTWAVVYNPQGTKDEWTSNPCGYGIQDRSGCAPYRGGPISYYKSGVVYATSKWAGAWCPSGYVVEQGAMRATTDGGKTWSSWNTYWTL
jgi:hypothetical protein